MLGRYYLGRVIKIGQLDTARLIAALRKPAVIRRRDHSWTLTNVVVSDSDGERYVYGRLNKFRPDATVVTVDERRRVEMQQTVNDLSIAASPFIYLPDHSGVAYLHVWNQIEQRMFVRRFCEIVVESLDGLFAECHVEPISDLRRFAAKIGQLERIWRIQSRVNPPNPLFGPLWEPLKSYLAERNASEMRVSEQSEVESSLRTEIQSHIDHVLSQTSDDPYEPTPLPVTDAALLMAADGYGAGLVEGLRRGERIIVRTSESILSFMFDKDPQPLELFNEARRHLRSIVDERQMRHDA